MKLQNLKCKICDKELKSLKSLSSHIRVHNVSSKEYYDKYLKNDDGMCETCGKTTSFNSITNGYCKYCSQKCSSNNKNVRLKFRQTCLDKYHSVHPNQNKKIQEKRKETCIKKYGGPVPLSNKINQTKTKETCIKKYGVENPSKISLVKEKKKLTCQKNWGVDNPSQSDTIQKKKEKTSLNRYGVINPYQNEKIKKKYKQTCLKNFGVDNFAKTESGRRLSRINSIRMIENQKLNGEPLHSKIGDNERKFLDKLQLFTNYEIIRQDPSFRYIIGRFPDGYIKELKLFILFDERQHFVDDYITYNEQSKQEVKDYLSLGEDYSIFRVNQKEWNQDPNPYILFFIEIIKRFKYEYC